MDLLTGNRFDVRSYGIGAAYAGWLLRELGADVDHRTALDPGGLGAWLAEGGAFEAGPGLARRSGAMLITDAPVTAANRAALEGLASEGPVTWITPWGLAGEWAERPASDLALYAASGWMSAVGDADREPLAPPGAQVQFIGGLYAAIAALVTPAGSREITDVPLIESLAATLIYDTVSFQYHGLTRERAGNRFSPAQPTLVTLPCKDGHVGIHAALHGQWMALIELVGHPELAQDPRFAMPLDRAANHEALYGYILPWLRERTRLQAYHELQAVRIPSSFMPDVVEVLDSPQLAAREAWRDVALPGGPQVRLPGAPFRVLAANEPQPASGEPGPWRPGALRVLDLSMGWAGPMVGYVLAEFGADVIKVEGTSHFDWWRGSRPPTADSDPWLIEISHVHNAVNRGKRGISLDTRSPEGRELVCDLARTADVIVENFAAGVMEKLGLTYEALSAANPRLVMMRLPGMGSTGPEAHYTTFGNTIEAMAGLSSITGYEDGPPMMLSNALGDPIGGLVGTVGVLAALAGRQQDGRGRLVECAQLEGFLPIVAEAYLEYQVAGELPGRRGNRRAGSEPSGLLPAAGGAWVAFEVRDDADWSRLAPTIGEAWALDPALASAAGRSPRYAELMAQLRAWSAGMDADGVVAKLLGAGIAAALVSNEADVLGLEPLVAGDFWVGHDRPPVGYHMYPSVAIRPGERPQLTRPAPILGEHTREVLAGLGRTQSEIDALMARGIAGEPAVAV
ncbi:MAG: CoA transferase [Dehalococcoidia bacterium]|nr:CoA transferase [Dehalococcoidia bacterium]